MILLGALLTFWFGVGLSNLAQQAKWINLHPTDPKMGYWKQGGGWGHLMGNLLFDAMVCAAWSSGLLDWLQANGMSKLPGGYPVPGYMKDIPVTPGLGLILGGLTDFLGDYVAFFVRRILGKWTGKQEAV